MNEVIPRHLWLGNAGDARAVEDLYQLGITAVVDLAAEEAPLSLTRDTTYCRFPLIDGGGNNAHILELAIETTASLIENRVPTLVFCGAGMSRAPAIIAAALACVRDDSLDECLQELLAGHPHDVSPLLWADVEAAFDRMVS